MSFLYHLFANNLIEVMGVIFIIALTLRYLAYRAGRRDEIYFGTFVKAVERKLNNETENQEQITDSNQWLQDFLSTVVDELPDRSFRSGPRLIDKSEAETGHFSLRDKKQTFKQYVEGKHSIALGIKQEAESLRSSHRPDFYDLSARILEQDKNWRTVAGIPVSTLSGVLDMLPGTFIVGGIFGTFIGITAALPVLAKIDLNNIDQSAPILNEFLINIAYSMNTSIAGIIFSVALTFLNTLFPVSNLRDAIWKNIERCVELIWYRIHENKISHSDQMVIKLLEEIAAKQTRKIA